MKDEIKEILDRLDFNEWEVDLYKVPITWCELYNIRDYITNLQEENERYKRIFEGKERFSKIMPDDTDFIILSKADYDRQQEDIELGLIDYKSRNEKAIKCIKNKYYKEEYERKGTFANKLMNILKGDDKDE